MRPDAKKTSRGSIFPDLNTPNDTLVNSQLNQAIVEYLASNFPNIARLEVIRLSR